MANAAITAETAVARAADRLASHAVLVPKAGDHDPTGQGAKVLHRDAKEIAGRAATSAMNSGVNPCRSLSFPSR